MESLHPDWGQVGSNLFTLLAAYVLALPIAWDRELQARSAGLRTFPLVALASCALVLIGKLIMPDSPGSQARLIQGLMTGVGFIGGGAILKHGMTVEGTATAASVWSTGVVGIAVAYSRYEIAIILAVLNFATLRLLTPLKRRLNPLIDDRDEDDGEPKGQGTQRTQGTQGTQGTSR
ncbi:MAG: MgtC/SapB family protein [Acidobacteria bacterium]|nr:MAG: MgtC/SapB family protein [Acidobacteriota bacterium]